MENEDYSPLFEDVINEKFETFVTRPKEFFKKDIHLYRYIRGKKLNIIKPTFLNNGTMLSNPRASSFWSPDKIVAISYGTADIDLLVMKELSKEDITHFNESFKKYEKYISSLDAKEQRIYKKNPINSLVAFSDTRANIVAYYDKYFTKNKVLSILKNLKFPEGYLYETTIHGWDSKLGIGRNSFIKEFTIDKDVIPEKITNLAAIPDDALENIIWLPSFKEMKDTLVMLHSEPQVSKFEKWLKSKEQRTFSQASAYKTKFFKNEFINDINNGEDIILLADTHFGRNTSVEDAIKDASETNKKFVKLLKENKNVHCILFLGDIIDRTIAHDKGIVGKILGSLLHELSKVNGLTRIIYILGNSEDSWSPKKMMEMDDYDDVNKGRSAAIAWVDYKIETDKYVFTHAPIDIPDGKINIHAHLHGSHKYWNADPEKCINVWLAADGPNPILLSDVLKYGPDKDAIVLQDDPTGGKSNKIMTKLYKKTALAEEVTNSEEVKISDVMNLISPIVYGFYSTKDGSRIDTREFIHNCDNLRSIYSVNWDPEKTLHDKLGICTDQSVVTRYLLNKFHPEIKVQLYALYKGRFGHCVCTFEDNGKYYYLEHAWDKEQGLHGPFNSEAELEDYLDFIYHKNHDKDNDDAVLVMKYNPSELTESYSIGFPELK